LAIEVPVEAVVGHQAIQRRGEQGKGGEEQRQEEARHG
jgi:hypothetical protein